MRFKKIIKLFESGNVCVTGLRGTGKDMLMSNVVVRRNQEYVSNVSYGGKFNELDIEKLNCGRNDYRNFIANKLNYYKYPYPIGSDVYISDVGIYFPSQYCNELNRDYKYLPTYFALSRQVSHNNVHINVQNLNRAWDKIREQSDIYIRCRRCIVIPKINIVIQVVTLYDKYQSCLDRVEPCKISVPILAKREVKQQAEMYLDKFRNTYGTIQTRLLIYKNKSNYDTYYFEKLLERGEKNEKTQKTD